MPELDGDRILILGYGLEGRSTHRYLTSTFPGRFVAIADRSRETSPELPCQRLYTGVDYLGDLRSYDVIVRSPGISPRTPELLDAARSGSRITSQTNILLADAPGKIVGVTGTKGKSTTASLIAAMLGAALEDVRLVGNIGLPPLDQLHTMTSKSVIVAELSSYQLEDARRSPQCAVFLGMHREHLDRHGTFASYLAAKARICQYQDKTDLVVYDSDNPETREAVRSSQSLKLAFSVEHASNGGFVDDGMLFVVRDGGASPIMPVSEIRLLGKGNLRNVLAASTLASALGVNARDIRAAVAGFEPLDHRLQLVGERAGILFYDDSIATIPEATMNAIDALGDRVETLIAGGFDRGLDFEELGAYLASHIAVKHLILFPDSGRRIAASVERSLSDGDRRSIAHVESMERAVHIALGLTSPGAICLLSPASPSFGMFVDFRDRGDQFRRQLGFAGSAAMPLDRESG